MKSRNRDLIYDEKNDMYTYKPTGETFPAMQLDDFARAKLDEAIDKFARAFVNATNGRIWGLPDQ
jgi:hypothetical protein